MTRGTCLLLAPTNAASRPPLAVAESSTVFARPDGSCKIIRSASTTRPGDNVRKPSRAVTPTRQRAARHPRRQRRAACSSLCTRAARSAVVSAVMLASKGESVCIGYRILSFRCRFHNIPNRVLMNPPTAARLLTDRKGQVIGGGLQGGVKLRGASLLTRVRSAGMTHPVVFAEYLTGCIRGPIWV